MKEIGVESAILVYIEPKSISNTLVFFFFSLLDFEPF